MKKLLCAIMVSLLIASLPFSSFAKGFDLKSEYDSKILAENRTRFESLMWLTDCARKEYIETGDICQIGLASEAFRSMVDKLEYSKESESLDDFMTIEFEFLNVNVLLTEASAAMLVKEMGSLAGLGNELSNNYCIIVAHNILFKNDQIPETNQDAEMDFIQGFEDQYAELRELFE